MGHRTGKEPNGKDTFLWRICHALDEPPRMLAKSIELPYTEIEPLLDHRHNLIEIDRDDTWDAISRHVDKRIATLLAVKAELNRALQSDRTKRLQRIETFERIRNRSLNVRDTKIERKE